MNDETSDEEFSDRLRERLEQELLPHFFQHIIVSLLKNRRSFKPDFIRQIKTVSAEARLIRNTLISQLSPTDSQRAKIACRDGCSHCCGMIVKPTMPELYIILEFIRDTYTHSEIDRLMSALHAQIAQKQACTSRMDRLTVYCTF